MNDKVSEEKQPSKYVQSNFKLCGANESARPSQCIYPTNMCCFACEHNKRCTVMAQDGLSTRIPCKPHRFVNVDGKRVKVELFAVDEKCEFAI